jgi:hypothetical protein
MLALAALLLRQTSGVVNISLDPQHVLHRAPPPLLGACLEDVNHEVYGGLYSQMLFGESFQEPPPSQPVGFRLYGGSWQVEGETLKFDGSPGEKAIFNDSPALWESVGLDVYVSDGSSWNTGLILDVSQAEVGADNFNGYEVALDGRDQLVRVGRHRHDWKPIQDAPAAIRLHAWNHLEVSRNGSLLTISVNGPPVLSHDDGASALPPGRVGLRQYQDHAEYRNLWIQSGGHRREVSFKTFADRRHLVSGMWDPVETGRAQGDFSVTTDRPFVGRRSQRIVRAGGPGFVGIANRGLNRQGLSLRAGKPYEGELWVRGNNRLVVELAGSNRILARQSLVADGGGWRNLAFRLIPSANSSQGSFRVGLESAGQLDLGYAFLDPGTWGRYKGLPVRRDVAEGLAAQHMGVMRYGGSVVLSAQYRWKNMIGPRDRRPPSSGVWYPYETNGWGIPDFLNLCEALGCEGIPTFNIDESPQDMGDFVEFANGSPRTKWGARRALEGHPQPYHLRALELGNEQRVDMDYYRKFKALAEAIWSRDPSVVLVVGDLAYEKEIADPFKFDGADSGITSLEAHQAILKLAAAHDREVWFDVHVWTDGPQPSSSLPATLSYIRALKSLSNGAKFKVAVFELNADNHSQRRAIANAIAINALEREGSAPVVTSANCLQVDGQNDNGWNQGLLFLNSSRVWLQPPGYGLQMYEGSRLDEVVETSLSPGSALDVCAERSRDGKELTVRIVNPSSRSVRATVILRNFKPQSGVVETLAGPLDVANLAGSPTEISPSMRRIDPLQESPQVDLPPNSVTVLRLIRR